MRILTNHGGAFLITLGVFFALCIGCKSSPNVQEAKYLRRGKEFLAKKDFSRATLEFRNAIRVMPADAEPYYQIGLVNLESNNPAGAFAAFNRAVELNPGHDEAQLKVAVLMATSGDPDLISRGEEGLKRLVSVLPESTEAISALALAELQLGKPGDAVKHLEEALVKFPSHLQSSVTLARLQMLQNDMSSAEEVLRKAVQSAPESANAIEALGQFYLVTRRPAEAENEFRRALNIDSKFAPALLSLGSIQLASGRMEEADQTYRTLSTLPDRAFRPLHAILLFETGKRDAAILELEDLAKVSPDDRDARARLVAAYLATNRIPEAVRVLEGALAKNPSDVDALFARSQIYARGGRYADAQKDLAQVLHFRSDSSEAHLALAYVYRSQGMARNCEQELNEALRLNPDYLTARLAVARTLLASGNARTALSVLNETPPSQRANVQVIIEQNWALMSSGKSDDFRTGVERGLAITRHPDLLLQKAILQMQARNFTGARTLTEELLRQNPEDVRAARLLADSYSVQGQVAIAVQKLREIVARRPQSPALQNLLGQFLSASGSDVEARKSFAAALAADETFAPASMALVELDLKENQIGAARDRITSLTRTRPRDSAVWLLAAKVGKSAKDADVSMSSYRAVLEIESGNVVALNNLAYLMLAKDVEGALKFAQRALEAAPEDPGVQDTLGWIYYRKGIYRTAIEHLSAAVTKQPTPLRRYHLGMAHVGAGNRELGDVIVRKALQDDPSLDKARQGL